MMKSSAHHIWWVGMLISSIILSWQSFYESDLLRYLLLSFWRSQVPTVTKKLLYRVIDLKNWHCYFIFFVHFLSNDKIMLEFKLQQKDLHTIPLVCSSLWYISFPTYFYLLTQGYYNLCCRLFLMRLPLCHFGSSRFREHSQELSFLDSQRFLMKNYTLKKIKINKNGWLFAFPVMFWGRAKHSFLNEKYYLESCVILLLLLLIVFIY